MAKSIILWLGVPTPWETVLEGHSSKKVEKHCSKGTHSHPLMPWLWNVSRRERTCKKLSEPLVCMCVLTRAPECGGTERVTQWWNACLAYSRLWVWVLTSTKDKQIPKTKMTDKSNKKQLCASNIFSSPGYISIRSQNVEDIKLNPSQSHWLPRSYFSLKPCGSVICNYYLEGAGALQYSLSQFIGSLTYPLTLLWPAPPLLPHLPASASLHSDYPYLLECAS